MEQSNSSSAIVVIAVIIAVAGVGAGVALTNNQAEASGGVRILPYSGEVTFTNGDETVTCNGTERCVLQTGVEYTYSSSKEGFKPVSGKMTVSDGDFRAICLVPTEDNISSYEESLTTLSGINNRCEGGAFSELAAIYNIQFEKTAADVFNSEFEEDGIKDVEESYEGEVEEAYEEL